MRYTVLLVLIFSALHALGQRPSVKCTENSPERRGEEGCTILASRSLRIDSSKPLYWHIDRFDSLQAAKEAAGPDGVAAEAHGSAWVLTVETQAEHHSQNHVVWIGPLTLPRADRYSIRVMSSLLKPGGTTPVHRHAGPEVFYVVSGEQCLETPDSSRRLTAGEFYVLPPDVIHRGRVAGATARRSLALSIYDAARGATHDLAKPPPMVPCH